MAEKEPEYQVTVISREDVTTYPKIATPMVNVLVTYVGGGLPPATVTIPKDSWTLELEKETVREDLRRRLTKKAETYTV